MKYLKICSFPFLKNKLGASLSILFTLISFPVSAACMIASINGASFGLYNVFTSSSNTSGVGSITVKCNGGGSSSFSTSLSTGQSNTYSMRVMKSGSNSLAYNLYTSAARTVVWGNGTGGSNIITTPRNLKATLSIYGEIPAQQDLGVGIYTDSITATVSF